jgi:hypothetical protein
LRKFGYVKTFEIFDLFAHGLQLFVLQKGALSEERAAMRPCAALGSCCAF